MYCGQILVLGLNVHSFEKNSANQKMCVRVVVPKIRHRHPLD